MAFINLIETPSYGPNLPSGVADAASRVIASRVAAMQTSSFRHGMTMNVFMAGLLRWGDPSVVLPSEG